MSKHLSSSASSKSDDASKLVEARIHALQDAVRVLGVAHDPAGRRIGIAFRLRGSAEPPLVCPIALTGRHHLAATESWLLEHGMDDVLQRMRVADFGSTLREMAGVRQVIVLNECGFHALRDGANTHLMTAWGGRLRHFGSKPSKKVVLGQDAAKPPSTSGSAESWANTLSPVASRNPRVLFTLCFSLSAAMRRPLGEPGFSLILVAPTSTAKSTLQQVCSSLIGKPEVIAWNATNQGLQGWLSDRPDQVACVEDVHKADKFEDIAQVLMNTGNNSARLRAGRGKGAVIAPTIEATLILSSEKSLASMASRASSGMLARCFELHAGALGMFDDPGSNIDPGTLANQLKQFASENYGAMWLEWQKVLSTSWSRVKKWYVKRLPEIRLGILKRAGHTNPDELTGRLVDRLAFASFAGCVAYKLGMWSVNPKEIQAAFALMLREHLDRQPLTGNALATAALDAVRAYIETHRASFPPLSSANNPHARTTISGYTTDSEHGPLFLFIPGVFRGQFSEFGDELFTALRSADYLVSQPGRYNLYEKKVPTGIKGKRRAIFFIAIKSDIRYAPEKTR